MNAERHKRLKSVFAEASSRAGSMRADYLDAACGGDAEMRGAVEELLRHDADPTTDRMLAGVRARIIDAAGLDDGAAPPPMPERIGTYRLLGKIGEGGMGVVYEAEQDAPRRTVALKLIASGFATPTVLRRFEHETEVLGRLQHPGIAQIYDAGTFESIFGRQPYFVMERVDGLPLLEHCTARGLGHRDRLALFARICDAVAHAHQKGVIHRDLKPANILVVDEAAAPIGAPKILDFGVARAIDDGGGAAARTGMTTPGQLVGTLAYMSPEQALGGSARADTRSDVYALGVILYELLTGQFPYDVGGPLNEVVDRICAAPPRRPAAHDRTIDGDAETIVLRCLDKDPARRYQSAADLARDVRHSLAGAPIEAKRDSRLYVMRKLVARHRFGAAAVIGIAVTLAAGLVVSWMAWRSTAAALEDVRDERARATAAAEKTTAVNAFLARMLSSADPDAGDVRDLTMREKLDQAVRILDAGALAGQPDVEATVRLTIGEAYLAIGQTGAAEPLLGGVLDAYLEQHGESAHPDVAGALEAMARLRRAQGRYDESDALFVRAIAMWRSVHPGDHADVARALMLHATLLHNASRRDEAITQARAALAMRERLHGFEHVEVARAKISLAYFVRDRSESLALVREALAAERAALGPNAPEVARALQSLGRLQHRAGEHAGAEASYLEAIDVARRAFGADHPLVVAVVLDLSFLYRSLGEIERGVGVAAEYDPAARAAFGEESLRYAKYVKWLGDVREEGGDAPAAESEFRRALAILARIGEERSLDAVRARVALAGTLIRQEAWDEAEAILRATMAEDESVLPASYWARPQAESLLGEVLGARGDFAQAESTLTAAFDRFMAIHVPRELRVSSAARLAAMYERWDAAAPGTGKAELAAHWRHQQRALAAP